VSTTDDRSVIADAEHLWAVRSFAPTRRAKLPRHMVATTEQLLTAGPVARRRGNSAEFRFRLPGQEAWTSRRCAAHGPVRAGLLDR